ncbi:unnamed product [Ostreococcus tauri]|uniref:Unnamed product n=1 Tax=Ostreococcus tauri TaxID=70448 RepID=A0A096PA23_OSTTA|nr:unnamed product [Ostreococcus tauri]CEG00772.1 unnamed product [Ostreococcus tauri]|eukprot:XP_003084202.2 unnamed product [Ostreococcus tauri]
MARESIDATIETIARAMTTTAASSSSTSFLGRDAEWPAMEGASLINRAIFQAPAPSYTARRHPWSPAHLVAVRSGKDYDFPCVWVPCRRTAAERVVIHCHANACDIGHIHSLCARDAECWRAHVLLVEYPGYGAASGTAYERSVDRHVAAAYAYVTEECGYKPKDVFVLGRSLGSGPATKLAAAVESLYGKELGGVILHSPFTSVKEVGLFLLGNIAHVMTDRWDNREWVQRYKAKTLIVHAVEDEVVPFEHAKILEEKRRELNLHCRLHSTHGTHNYFSYYRDYLQPILDFIESTVKPGGVPYKVAPLPDPIPRAGFSEAQVRNIMSLVKAQAPPGDSEQDSVGLRFYGMVDAMGETISPREGGSLDSKKGFARFGSNSSLSAAGSAATTPQNKRSISPNSTIDGNTDVQEVTPEDVMILTPGGSKPRFLHA